MRESDHKTYKTIIQTLELHQEGQRSVQILEVTFKMHLMRTESTGKNIPKASY